MIRKYYFKNVHCSQQGFTLVEVIAVIVVLSILVTITLGASNGYMERARDVEREKDVAAIARELERTYRAQAANSGPSYPATTIGLTAFATLIDDQDSLIAPGSSAPSIIMATDKDPQTPDIDHYTYQPLTSAGQLCTTTPCPRFILYYRKESGAKEVIAVHSMRQQ